MPDRRPDVKIATLACQKARVVRQFDQVSRIHRDAGRSLRLSEASAAKR